jgi:uncharacterized small protein (DUF1192 family)
MDGDEDVKPKGVITLGEPLDALSIDELENRISACEAEIARLKGTLADKRQSQAAAASFFKT